MAVSEMMLNVMTDPMAIMAVGGMLLAFIILLLAASYVYFALVLQSLAKKLGYKKTWLAWIPVANLALWPILNKKHWAWVFMFLVPIANLVFYLIWSWKIFERRKYPGWLCLIGLLGSLPYIGWLATIATAIIWGFVAWKDM